MQAKPLKRIFLVRHGESMANVDHTLCRRVPDHAVDLTERGKLQAYIAGKNASEYIKANVPEDESIRLWYSPYNRTTQTTEYFVEGMGYNRLEGIREDVSLVEQAFGLFDGLSSKECAEKFPEENALYDKHADYQGKFYARNPHGESRFDVYLRTKGFFGTLIRDAERDENPIPNVIIVAHSITNRVFNMGWLHKPVDWIENSSNPPNASVQLIDGTSGRYQDKGFIYGGIEADKLNFKTTQIERFLSRQK